MEEKKMLSYRDFEQVVHAAVVNKYGNNPPVQCRLRLENELEIFRKTKSYEDIPLLDELFRLAEEDGSEITGHGYGTSFVHWLLGFTGVNPLPPHHHCEICKSTVFYTDGDGWDLPTRYCCGRPMLRDGHSIPCEAILPQQKNLKQNLKRSLSFEIARSFASKAEDAIRTACAGEFKLVPIETPVISDDLLKYALIPRNDNMPEVDEQGIWHTGAIDEQGAWHIDVNDPYVSGYRTVEFHLSDNKERIKAWKAVAKQNISTEEFLADPVLSVVESRLLARAEKTKHGALLPRSDKLTFGYELKLLGYLYRSTHEEGAFSGIPLSDTFTSREEVWDVITKAIKREYGVNNDFAVKVTRCTRMGMFTNSRMDAWTEQLLVALGIPVHLIEQMKHIYFLPEKADLIPRLAESLQLAWMDLQNDSSAHIQNT